MDVLYWAEPDGTVTQLTEDVTILEGVNGLRVPPIRRTHEAVAGVPGTRLRTIAHDMRTLDLPIMFDAASELELRAVLRAWEARFDPTRGGGQIWVVAVDNKVLALNCSYVEGLEGNEDGSHRFEGEPLRLAVLMFESDDPYWYEIIPTSQTWTLGGAVPFWFDPPTLKAILPIQLGASSLNGVLDIDVNGQVATWPVWRFDGPGSLLTVRNDTTGREFAWDGTLAAGDILEIDTRPGAKTVLLNGSSAFGLMSSWDLWPLQPGENSVSVLISDATPVTEATATWHPAWLGY